MASNHQKKRDDLFRKWQEGQWLKEFFYLTAIAVSLLIMGNGIINFLTALMG